MSTTLLQIASQNLTDVLRDVFLHDDSSTALVVYDLNSPLSILLTERLCHCDITLCLSLFSF